MTNLLATENLNKSSDLFPPILLGQHTGEVQKKVEKFYLSLDEILERWFIRRQSPHTQRAYRQDIESLLEFLKISRPDESLQLLRLTVADVQNWRDQLIAEGNHGVALEKSGRSNLAEQCTCREAEESRGLHTQAGFRSS